MLFPSRVMQFDPSIIVALISLFGTIFVAAMNLGKMSKADAVKLEHRLTSLEEKIEPIWEAIIKEIPRLLISPHSPEFDKLVEKSLKGIDTLTPEELERLEELVDAEYEVAVEEKNSGRAIGLVLMRAGIRSNHVKTKTA